LPVERTRQDDASWTILCYEDGDNSLSDYIMDDVLEMADVGSTTELNIVVLLDLGFDRRAYFDNTTREKTGVNVADYERAVLADNQPAQLYYVEAEFLDELGTEAAGIEPEPNMGKSSTLQKFISYGVSNFPAQHTALFMGNHGLSFKGFMFDDYSNDHLTPSEMRTALATVGHKFDIIGFDACLMSSMSMVYEASQFCDYVIASELTEPGNGWDYTCFEVAKQNPNITPENFAIEIVDAYSAQYTYQTHTLAAIDSSAFQEFMFEFDILLNNILQDADSYKVLFDSFFLPATDYYLNSVYSGTNFYDFYEFVDAIALYGGHDVDDIKAKWETARVDYKERDVSNMFCGISIYVPTTVEVGSDFANSRFCRATQYNEVVFAGNSPIPFNEGIDDIPDVPTVAKDDDNIVKVTTSTPITKYSPDSLLLGNDVYSLDASVNGLPSGFGFYEVQSATVVARSYNGKYFSDVVEQTFDNIDGVLIEGPPAVVGVELTEGWNLVSFPITTVGEMKASTIVDTYYGIEAVAMKDNSTYLIYRDEGAFKDNDFVLDSQTAYFVYASSDTTVSVTGTEITAASYNLEQGWNLVPVYYDIAVSGLAGKSVSIEAVAYKTNGASNVYIKGLQSQSDYNLKKGDGIWVYASQDVIVAL